MPPESPGTDADGFEIRFFESVLRRLPSDPQVIGILAELYTREGRVEDGLKLDRKLVRLEPENPTAHYNLACSLALKGRVKASLDSLREAFRNGYDDVAWMLEDPDLERVRQDWRFQGLLHELGLFGRTSS